MRSLKCGWFALLLLACGGDDNGPGSVLDLSYPNEPAGATVLMDYDADFGNLNDPPWGFINASSQDFTTVTDATAPVNSNSVGRVRFQPGCCNGTGPGRLETYTGTGRGVPSGTWSRWYVSDWVKFDPAFKPHACCQKIFEFYMNAGSGAGSWVIVKADPTSPNAFPVQPRFTTEYSSGSNNWSQSNFQIQPGIWYQYEVIVHASGRLQMWIRAKGGTPTAIYDGTPSGMGTPSSMFLFWWWGYGGLGAYPSGAAGYIYHNHMRSSFTP